MADPTAPLAEAWTHQRFGTATEYKGIMLDGVAAIRAIGRNSASGLYRDFRYRIAEHPWIELKVVAAERTKLRVQKLDVDATLITRNGTRAKGVRIGEKDILRRGARL